ncbi:hypothetical protein BT69DRAFT_1353438 [Atractiella rhizophila]|nr:hypothetical protein BT69DRAFT_1353438 [Atractiella rhizophila]
MKYLFDLISNASASTSSHTSTSAQPNGTALNLGRCHTSNRATNGELRTPATTKISLEREAELKALAVEATTSWMDPNLASFVSLTEMEHNSAQHRAWEDFYKTLERIVNEIRSHELATPFLNKVKKAEAADYYKIIHNPIDLGQILKRVQSYRDNLAMAKDAEAKAGKPHHKSKAYKQYQEDHRARERELLAMRTMTLPNGNPFTHAYYKTKKEFAEELDLVWENCLRYNTLPSHPLRKVANTLRAKCNQLLDFVEEPKLPVLHNAESRPKKKKYQPALPPQPLNAPVRPPDKDDERTLFVKRKRVIEDDDEEDDEMPPSKKRKSGSFGEGDGKRKIILTDDEMEVGDERGKKGPEDFEVAEALENGRKVEEEDRKERERARRLPLNKRPFHVRPSEDHVLEGFAEWPAFERLADGMAAFMCMENNKRFRLNSSSILPSSKGKKKDEDSEIASQKLRSTVISKLMSIPTKRKFDHQAADKKDTRAAPPHSASSASMSPPLSHLSLGHDSDSTKATTSRDMPTPKDVASSFPSHNIWATNEPPDIFADLPQLQSFPPSAWWLTTNLDLLARSGIPGVPFRDCAVDEEAEEEERRERIQREGRELQDETGGLLKKMQSNIATLDRIRKLHNKIGMFKATHDPRHLTKKDPPTEDEPDLEIPPEAFSSSIADQAGKLAIQQVIARLCQHAGFDAANKMAIDVVCSMTADYMNNIGQTMKLYVDRYGGRMTDEDILLHTCRHNGVAPASLQQYVKDDIERYGVKLKDTQAKLEKASTQLLSGYEAAQVIGDDRFFSRDGEALITGDFMYDLGEDFFGIGDLGLDTDLGGKMRLDIPVSLFRGDGKRADKDSNDLRAHPHSRIRFRKPPPFVPLDEKAISSQIGPLQSIFRERLKTEKVLKEDDQTLVGKARLFRAKVPPGGKIPIKKKPEPKAGAKLKKTRVATLKAEANTSKKKKQKGKELAKLPVVMEETEPLG